MTCVDTLPPSLRELVDSRLDSIERVLLSTNINRSERREIVQSVDDQVYELLGRRDETDPSRESVLAVLAMIDPPEAYLISNDGLKQAPPRGDSHIGPVDPGRLVRRIAPLAIVSCALGILGLVSLFLSGGVLWPVSAITGLAATVCGTIALTQIHYSDCLRGLWLSIIGIGLPVIAMTSLFVLVVM